jgi:hypothetical protein
MRTSGNRLGLRASDAERDQAIGELRDQFAEGRLSQETFLYRMDAALRAKDRSELYDLFADLPDDSWRRQGADLAVRHRLARFFRSAGDWLGAGRRRRYAAASPPYPPGPAAPPNVIPVAFGSQVHVGYQGPAYARAAEPEPQSLCLPPLADRRFTIGRAPSCDFTVPDLSVSRWHARLHKEDGSWLLSDLGSTNGTRVNGWRVTSAVPVQPGDQVCFGSVAYVITERPVAAPRPGTPV